jgi:hypothetical protein
VPWQASDSKGIAQVLHVAAVTGLIGPGYAKRDAKLRRAAGVKPATAQLPDEALHVVLSQAASTGSSAWALVDIEWFNRRWQLGEEAAIAAQSRELVAALTPLGVHALLPTVPRVQASTAVGRRPIALTSPPLVIAAADCSPAAIAVSLIGAQLRGLVATESLSAEDRRWMADFMACTVIRELVGEVVFTDWVTPLMGHLVGEFERGSTIQDRVRRIALACLDQPPGEIERIGVGLGRRLQSRLTRAIRRGFFTPPNVDLAAWLDARLPATEPSETD